MENSELEEEEEGEVEIFERYSVSCHPMATDKKVWYLRGEVRPGFIFIE